MATWPAKTNYATGDVLTAAQMQDIGNALNSVQSAQYAAGKNKIINGDFAINQRAFTSTTTTATYGFDRFLFSYNGGTTTYSTQTFTLGAAPVAGYEATNFARLVTTSQSTAGNFAYLLQKIEDVRTFAGQTVTFSFWAKAASGTPNIGISFEQTFGSGGSATVVTSAATQTITTSWARYTFTVAIPSISGKTIGSTATSFIAGIFVSAGTNISGSGYPAVGLQNNTFDIWGVQVEAGNTATAFQTATGTLAGELAACQRYYYVLGSAADRILGAGFNQSASRMHLPVIFPVTMRTAPTLSATSGTNYYNLQTTIDDNFNSLTIGNAQIQSCYLFNNTEIAGTAGQAGMVVTANAAASVAFSAEL